MNWPRDLGTLGPIAERNIKFGPGTIETFSGEAYDFAAPMPDMIHFDDIRQALSNMCRFAGHTRVFYSVAEHSVLVSKILQRQGEGRLMQIAGLLHDSHEAYVWDAPRPFKPLLGSDFAKYAKLADYAISQKLLGNSAGAAGFHFPEIKAADNIALCAEREELMTAGPDEWERGYEDVPPLPEGLAVRGLEPIRASYLFLDRALQLGLTKEGTF